MKITAHVLSAADAGDQLRIIAQGPTEGAASWRPYSKIEFTMPLTKASQRAFWIGRKISIEVKPL